MEVSIFKFFRASNDEMPNQVTNDNRLLSLNVWRIQFFLFPLLSWYKSGAKNQERMIFRHIRSHALIELCAVDFSAVGPWCLSASGCVLILPSQRWKNKYTLLPVIPVKTGISYLGSLPKFDYAMPNQVTKDNSCLVIFVKVYCRNKIILGMTYKSVWFMYSSYTSGLPFSLYWELSKQATGCTSFPWKRESAISIWND